MGAVSSGSILVANTGYQSTLAVEKASNKIIINAKRLNKNTLKNIEKCFQCIFTGLDKQYYFSKL